MTYTRKIKEFDYDSKANRITGLIFLLIGVIVLVVSLFFVYKIIHSHTDGIFITGTITHVSEELTMTEFSYLKDGISTTGSINVYSDLFKVGKTIEVYYYPTEPTKFYSSFTDVLLSSIFGGFSILFILISILLLIYPSIKTIEENKLFEKGKKTYAKLMDIKLENKIQINHVSPYVLYCETTINGIKYNIKSRHLWNDPKSYIETHHIQEFALYYNPNNPKKHALKLTDYHCYDDSNSTDGLDIHPLGQTPYNCPVSTNNSEHKNWGDF